MWIGGGNSEPHGSIGIHADEAVVVGGSSQQQLVDQLGGGGVGIGGAQLGNRRTFGGRSRQQGPGRQGQGIGSLGLGGDARGQGHEAGAGRAPPPSGQSGCEGTGGPELAAIEQTRAQGTGGACEVRPGQEAQLGLGRENERSGFAYCRQHLPKRAGIEPVLPGSLDCGRGVLNHGNSCEEGAGGIGALLESRGISKAGPEQRGNRGTGGIGAAFSNSNQAALL